MNTVTLTGPQWVGVIQAALADGNMEAAVGALRCLIAVDPHLADRVHQIMLLGIELHPHQEGPPPPMSTPEQPPTFAWAPGERETFDAQLAELDRMIAAGDHSAAAQAVGLLIVHSQRTVRKIMAAARGEALVPLDDFGAEVADHAITAKTHLGGRPHASWSGSIQIAVMLILGNQEGLARLGMASEDAAARYLAEECMTNPPADMDLWVAQVRAEVDAATR